MPSLFLEIFHLNGQEIYNQILAKIPKSKVLHNNLNGVLGANYNQNLSKSPKEDYMKIQMPNILAIF